jgi:hypothetical protein
VKLASATRASALEIPIPALRMSLFLDCDKLGAKGLGGTASTRRKTARLAGDPEHLTAGQPMALVTVDAARGPIFQAWGASTGPPMPPKPL